MVLLNKTTGSTTKLSNIVKVLLPLIAVFIIAYLIFGEIVLVLSVIVLTIIPVAVSETAIPHIEKRIRNQKIGKLRYVFYTVFCISLSYLSILIIFNNFQLRSSYF